MNWDKLDLHLENLIPGMVLLSIIAFYWTPNLSELQTHSVVIGIAFVALSYLLGAVGNIFARMLLDPISARTLRTPMIRLLARQKIDDLEDTKKDTLNRRYSFLIDSAMICGNDSVVKEILKRRQTARLCRSALVPVLLLVVRITPGYWSVVTLFLAYLFMLLLYAYSEVAIFTEAHRGYRILCRRSESQESDHSPNNQIQPPC